MKLCDKLGVENISTYITISNDTEEISCYVSCGEINNALDIPDDIVQAMMSGEHTWEESLKILYENGEYEGKDFKMVIG